VRGCRPGRARAGGGAPARRCDHGARARIGCGGVSRPTPGPRPAGPPLLASHVPAGSHQRREFAAAGCWLRGRVPHRLAPRRSSRVSRSRACWSRSSAGGAAARHRQQPRVPCSTQAKPDALRPARQRATVSVPSSPLRRSALLWAPRSGASPDPLQQARLPPVAGAATGREAMGYSAPEPATGRSELAGHAPAAWNERPVSGGPAGRGARPGAYEPGPVAAHASRRVGESAPGRAPRPAGPERLVRPGRNPQRCGGSHRGEKIAASSCSGGASGPDGLSACL